jgi:hypothetical protein
MSKLSSQSLLKNVTLSLPSKGKNNIKVTLEINIAEKPKDRCQSMLLYLTPNA